MNQSQTIDLQVKISLTLNDNVAIKKVPTPQTLKDLVEQCVQFCRHNKVPTPGKQEKKIFYTDVDNDKIEVTDDQDLQMAYAIALSSDMKVKFFIELPKYKHAASPKPVEPVQEISQPIVENVIVPEPQQKQPVEEPVQEIALQEENESEVPNIEADLSDEHPNHHWGKKGKGKKGKKGKCGGGAANMPRKAIKNLIRNELETAVPGLFDKLMKDEENVVEGQQSIEESKDGLVVHKSVECDGCGVAPITGIRYKCAICKDFDYCAKCEENLGHDHPFLKIRKAGGAPSAIIAVLNEEGEKPTKPDWQEMKKAWHQMKGQFGHGHHGRGPHGHGPHGKPAHEWTEEEIANKTMWWKNMVGGFMNKMGVDSEKFDWKEAKEQWKNCKKEMKGGCNKEQWQDCKKEWKGCKEQWKGCRKEGGQGAYKLKRAIIVSNPADVLEALPGQVVIHDFEIKNNTHWGWKQGVYLSLDQTVEQTGMPIELVNIPIENKVEAMENLKMSVPITVLDSAQPSDKVFEFALRFRGPKGGEIGEPIPMKIKVVAAKEVVFEKVVAQEPKVVADEVPAKPSHLELVKLAVKLFDTDKLGQTFQECLEVVTLVQGDEEVAKKSLQPRQ